MAETKVKQTDSVKVKEDMSRLGRHYLVDNNVLASETKKYNHLDSEVKIFRFAEGSMGTLSDTFILYAIAMLGVCDKETIKNFLIAYSVKNPSLTIADPTNRDALRSRIKAMVSNGFLFRIGYTIEVPTSTGNESAIGESVLYTLDDGSLRFVCQRLGKKIDTNQWICGKPLEDMIAWASSSYLITMMGLDKSFVDFKQGKFRCKALKLTMMTAELITQVGDTEYNVACFPAFLHMNNTRQTKSDYTKMVKDKIVTIEQYMIARAAKEKEPYVVIACESSSDMEKMAQEIINDGTLLDYKSRVFFAGEGAIMKGDRHIKDSMFILTEAKGGYGLVLSPAPFLIGEDVTYYGGERV